MREKEGETAGRKGGGGRRRRSIEEVGAGQGKLAERGAGEGLRLD